MKVRPSVIIVKDGKVLLMKYNYSGSDVFGLPGGNPDAGETLESTLIREIKEELQVDLKVDRLAFVGEVIVDSKATLHCVFTGSISCGRPELDCEQTTALACTWIEISQLANLNLYPNIGKHIADLINCDGTPNPYIGQIQQNWF